MHERSAPPALHISDNGFMTLNAEAVVNESLDDALRGALESVVATSDHRGASTRAFTLN